MSVSKVKYGTMPDGRDVYEYILSNGNVTAQVINYGGIITKLITKDKNGNDIDLSELCNDEDNSRVNRADADAIDAILGQRVADDVRIHKPAGNL